jgi:hypothetical protein
MGKNEKKVEQMSDENKIILFLVLSAILISLSMFFGIALLVEKSSMYDYYITLAIFISGIGFLISGLDKLLDYIKSVNKQ